MQLTSNETMFLNMIKPTCIQKSIEERVCPSVMAALAIKISNWGTSREFVYTRNVYAIHAQVGEWFFGCWSPNTNEYYESPDKCTKVGINLYRVYNTHQESISDFISELVNARSSSSGPFRYASIIRCTDYKETINRLKRAQFDINYLRKNADLQYWGDLLTLIENNKLYEWDEEYKNTVEEEISMSKRRRIHIDRTGNSNVEETSNTNEISLASEESDVEEDVAIIEPVVEEHMYRVRLSWDHPDSQIFASINYADAKEECMKHEGYKIYIDDDGELFEDPWKDFYNTPVEEKVSDPDVKNVIHPVPGKLVVLNKTPVYKKAIDKTPFCYMSGDFYFYDNTIVLGKAKITKIKNTKNPSDPHLIFGYINI